VQISKKELIKAAKFEMCKRDFFYYCKTKAKEFYKEDRIYLKEMCETLQEFSENSDDVLIINLPP